MTWEIFQESQKNYVLGQAWGCIPPHENGPQVLANKRVGLEYR